MPAEKPVGGGTGAAAAPSEPAVTPPTGAPGSAPRAPPSAGAAAGINAVVVHPLVLLAVVDHYGRVAKDTRKRVVGVLLGETYKGRGAWAGVVAGGARRVLRRAVVRRPTHTAAGSNSAPLRDGCRGRAPRGTRAHAPSGVGGMLPLFAGAAGR